MDIFDYDVGDFLERNERRIEGKVVALGSPPALVGIEIIEILTEFVCACSEYFRLLGRLALESVDNALRAHVGRGMHEDIDDVFNIAQHIVGTAAYDYTRFLCGELMHEFALRLVYAVGARYSIANPRHRVKAHGELNDAAHNSRCALVVSLEIIKMAKTKFNIITSTCVPLPLENVDTDQIIPARFLKATTREEKFFGDNLFRDWRYNADGSLNKDFVLNNPTYGGQVLVAGKNFGSGSSREHAAWAIAGYGFRVVVSSFFADIHKNNELNNFVLPVVVTEGFLQELFDSIEADPKMEVEVNLPEQIIINKATGKSEHFEINAYKKHCLMNGLDDIDFLLSNKDKIEEWEKKA